MGGAVTESLRACCVEYCFPGSVIDTVLGGAWRALSFLEVREALRVVSQVGFVD